MRPRLHLRIRRGLQRPLEQLLGQLGILLKGGDARQAIVRPRVQRLLIRLSQHSQEAFPGLLQLAAVVKLLGLLQELLRSGQLRLLLGRNRLRLAHGPLLRELHLIQPLLFPLQVDGVGELREVEAHRLLLLFVARQRFGKMRRQDVAFPQRLLHQRLPARVPGRQPRLDRLDQALGRQQQEILLEGLFQQPRAQRVVDERLLLVHRLGVPHEDRVEQVMQVGMPHVGSLRLRRRSYDDEVIVGVTARVNLVGRAQQVHIDLKPPPQRTAGRVAQVGVHFKHGAADRLVVSGDGPLVGRLRLPP